VSQRSTVVVSSRSARTRRAAAVVRSAASMMVEPLEGRQLMSMVIDLRLPGGGKTANVAAVGNVVKLEVWATVKGADSTGSNDGLEIAVGSLLSSNANGGAANGTLKVTPAAPFNSFGSSGGVQRDLDGDGDLDVGSNVTANGSDYFAVRSAGVTENGTVSGASNSFKIANATFTVTSLKSTTGQTNLVFRPRGGSGSSVGGVWQEDGAALLKKDISGGSLSAGSALVIKRGSVGSPPPPPPPASTTFIGGKVWNDTNSNGTLDSGEAGKSGVKVFVDKNKNGSLDSGEPNQLTNSAGTYNFSGLPTLPAGSTYRVRIQTPSGNRLTNPTSGFLDTSGGWSNKNFGITTNVLLSGRIFADANNNGSFGTGDSALVGWKVFLDRNFNGKQDAGEVGTTTDSSGNYIFRAQPAMHYHLVAVPASGYTRLGPSTGFYDLPLTSGQTRSFLNFRYKKS